MSVRKRPFWYRLHVSRFNRAPRAQISNDKLAVHEKFPATQIKSHLSGEVSDQVAH